MSKKSARKTQQVQEELKLDALETLQTEAGVEETRKRRPMHPNMLSNVKLEDKQHQVIQMFDDSEVSILQGSPGTGKTFLCCYYALKALKENRYEKIILTKPIQESGENLGFLPGTVEEKIGPFVESFKVSFIRFIGKDAYDKLILKGIIEYRPIAYMRGADFRNTLLICDEAQNANIAQLITFITRMSEGSRAIIAGDTNQSDIQKSYVALPYLANLIKDIEGVGVFEFGPEDCRRNPILKEITIRYETEKAAGKLPRAHNN